MTRETCDVLIIGSGIGGLSAAALLVAAGYKPIVIEKSPRIGGRSRLANRFVRACRLRRTD